MDYDSIPYDNHNKTIAIGLTNVKHEISEISGYADREEPASCASSSDWLDDKVTSARQSDSVLRRSVTPAPPVIGAELLTGPRISFLEFLVDDAYEAYRTTLFGENETSVTTALQDFRKATEFHYFGHRSSKPGQAPPKNPGLLDATTADSKKALKEFTQLAYRGDPDHRGPLFWKKIAGLLWQAYEGLMALQVRAEAIRKWETIRMERISQKRSARADYMRRYRTERRINKMESNQQSEVTCPSARHESNEGASTVADDVQAEAFR